ncbi:transposase [Amphibacillus indicireducens]|uniref:Transposase n=1 Tax=Amphibacillus indicireducens TaxID=1076330 RepID=A0ABP7VJW2_9BACI
MFPYQKILKLHSEGVSLRSIASITQHSRQKVTEVINLAEKKGVKLPFEEGINDSWLEDFLYPEKKQESSGRHMMDFDKVHDELAKPNVTLTLLHDEYVREAKSVGRIPYAYLTFAEHYHDYALKYKATMRIRRKPGEILEVDWAAKQCRLLTRIQGKTKGLYFYRNASLFSIILCRRLLSNGLAFMDTASSAYL